MKTTFQYDHYYQYEELKQCLQQLAASYPALCSLESICTTAEGRSVFAVTLTNAGTGAPLSKPAFYIDANTHAGEVTGSMAAMHAIDCLLTNYGSDPKITSLLDDETVYVIPRISPDGAETYLSTPAILRSVDRKYLPEKGGIYDQDLDQDGVVRMMRIKTPYGAWKKDGSTMALRAPDDTEGTFYDIYPEGMIEDYDGSENLKHKKRDWTLDFNRNYPFGWCPEGRQQGAGKYPLSNPENKSVVDFVLCHPNICCVSTNHTSGGVILYPPGTRHAKTAPKEDIDAFIAIGNMGKEEMGYEPINIFDSFIESQEHYDSGAFDDWCYETQGIPAYTMELWDPQSRAGVPIIWNSHHEEPPETGLKRFNACMEWVRKNAPQYWQDWHEVSHPQLGTVEVGGFDIKHTIQNPPESFLLQECEKMTAFMIRYAKTVPHLVLESPACRNLGEDLYEVSVIAGNTGYLPTALTANAALLKVVHPITVALKGAETAQGSAEQKIEVLSGYSRTGISDLYGNLTTTENAPARKKLTWIVRGQAGTKVTVSAVHEKAGTAEICIALK